MVPQAWPWSDICCTAKHSWSKLCAPAYRGKPQDVFLGRQRCQILKLLAPSAEIPSLLPKENRTTTASVASAIRSVVNPAVMPAARTLAESDREGERNAKSLKLF